MDIDSLSLHMKQCIQKKTIWGVRPVGGPELVASAAAMGYWISTPLIHTNLRNVSKVVRIQDWYIIHVSRQLRLNRANPGLWRFDVEKLPSF